MSKHLNPQKEKKRNVGMALKRAERKRVQKKFQTKLSEFFRSSPLAEIDVSRDNTL